MIVLDWQPLALPASKYSFKPIRYAKAVRNVKTVAERLAAFVIWLKEDFDVDLDQVHLIGHSLGAHVAGNAGHMVIQRLGYPVGRITGELCLFSPDFTMKWKLFILFRTGSGWSNIFPFVYTKIA